MNIKPHINFFLVVILLSMTVFLVYRHIFSSPSQIREASNHKEFSSRISFWTANDVEYNKAVLSQLSPDRIVYKTYENKAIGLPITLFIAYYNNMEKADLSHSPLVCFTGQGWEISETKTVEIPLDHSQTIRVNQMTQKKLNTTMITLYWYQSVDRVDVNRGIQKVFLFFSKLLGRRDNNGFVRITANLPEGKDYQEVVPHIFRFIKDMYPELKRFFV